MTVCEVSVVPVGTDSPSVSEYVAEAQRIIKRSGLKSHLSPMCTCVEGELSRILELVTEMDEACFSKGAKRVITTLKIDERRDKPLTMNVKTD